MKLGKTERGFARGEFVDKYGQFCSIQKSSLATEDCIWLGVDTDLEGNEVSQRMHLNQDMVEELLPLLKRFIKKGEL